MTKIVHLTSAHSRYDDRILWRECVSLRKLGYDVAIVVNDAQPDETLENGIKILSTGIAPQGRWKRMTEGVKKVFELGLQEDGEIYHLHDPELLRVALKLKKSGKKVIFDSHEFYVEMIKGKQWISPYLRKIISSIYDKYEKFICKKIDGVIYVAKYNGRNWFAGRARRSAYVGNFPRLDEFGQISIPSYNERRGVCYSGQIAKNRGILNILKAINLAKTNLVIAGEFESDEFHEEFFEYDTNHVVDYVGFLGRREIFELYAKHAIGICVFPLDGGQRGRIEGFNNKVYEYMSMEMPVILSDWPYKRRMVEKYRFGLVANPDDVEDIAEKISWLIRNPEEAEEMGKNGKKLLTEKFLWEKSAEPELLRLYREIG